jgi:hypothetical protein
LLCAGIAAPVSAQSASADELDAAIRAVSDYLNKQLPGGNKLAILNIQSEFPALSEYIIDELIANTVNDRIFSVVDRQQLNTIRTELEFQMSGEVNDESAQSIGQMLGAEIIISGAVSRIGGLYRLRVRALSVQSAQIAGQFNQNIPSGPTIAALVQSSATGYGAASGGGGAVQTSAPVPAAPAGTYKVGDTGPGGGIIFYDKGNSSGGWRYLEAAPAMTDKEVTRTLPGERQFGRAGNSRLGAGKSNTEIMSAILDRSGGGINTAYWICYNLNINGYDDWYLPSLDELLLLYNFYNEYNLAGFYTAKYWSSTHKEEGYVLVVDFRNGQEGTISSGAGTRVRAIRQF